MVILSLLKQIRHPCHRQEISHTSKKRTAVNEVTLPGLCTTLCLSLQLSALSLRPRGSAWMYWMEPSVSLDLPPVLLRAAFPGLQCAGSPFPTVPSLTGPPGASVLSPAPTEWSSPGSAAPAEGQQGEEKRGQQTYGRRAEHRLGEVKGQHYVGRNGETIKQPGGSNGKDGALYLYMNLMVI